MNHADALAFPWMDLLEASVIQPKPTSRIPREWASVLFSAGPKPSPRLPEPRRRRRP